MLSIRESNPQPFPSTLLEHALSQAARGFYVFPVHGISSSGQCTCAKKTGCRPGKHPRVKWSRLATLDAERLRSWWAKWPDANIAIACGPSGLVVLDIDGDDGFRSLTKLRSAYGSEAFETLTVSTGGAGLHLYFVAPAGAHIACSKASDNPIFGPGIDVRAAGGYVIAPGSMHGSGRKYVRLAAADEPKPLPPQLLNRLQNESLHPPVGVWGWGRNETNFSRKQAETPNNTYSGKNRKNPNKVEPRLDARRDPRPQLAAVAQMVAAPVDKGGAARIARWAQRWQGTPGLRSEGSPVLSRQLFAVAREYVRVAGPRDAEPFLHAVARKRAISPDLWKPSATTGDRQHPFSDKRAKRAWGRACAEPFGDLPIALDGYTCASRSLRGAARVYAFLFLDALRLGVRPTNYSKDSRSIAICLGSSQPTVWRWIKAAEEAEILQVTDRGRLRTAGKRGQPMRFELLTRAAQAAEAKRKTTAIAETLQVAVAAADSREKQRRAA